MDIVVFRGPKRSGNHLLINWLLAHYEAPFLLNNADECVREFGHANVVDALKVCAAAKRRRHDVAVISLEKPERVDVEHLQNLRRIAEGLSAAPCRLPYLLRDPLNWMASILHKDGPVTEAHYARVHGKLWDNWYANFRNWCRSPEQIDFNEFLSSADYRCRTSLAMGLRPDSHIDAKVLDSLWHPNVVRASSFDSAGVRAGLLRPSQMQVTARFCTVMPYFVKFGVPDFIQNSCQQHWPSVFSSFVQAREKGEATGNDTDVALTKVATVAADADVSYSSRT